MTRPGSLEGKTNKKKVSLHETLEKRLRIYALGAGAAAGVLASPSPAMAEIVYTPTNVSISSYAETVVPINIDGTTEFKLIATFYYRNSGFFLDSTANVLVGAGPGAAVARAATFFGFPAALKLGSIIGSSGQFQGGNGFMAEHFYRVPDSGSPTSGTFGEFANTTDRYLGLKFTLQGQAHYGWARFRMVKVSGRPGQQHAAAIFTGYAFETVPNKPIYAGQTKDSSESQLLPANDVRDTAALQPPTLGLLALGSPGLNAWRKKEALEGVPW